MSKYESVADAARAFEKFSSSLNTESKLTNESTESSLEKFIKNPENYKYFSAEDIAHIKEPTVQENNTQPVSNSSSLKRQLEDLTRTQLESMILDMYSNEKKYKRIVDIVNS